jgi:hypothetical protein
VFHGLGLTRFLDLVQHLKKKSTSKVLAPQFILYSVGFPVGEVEKGHLTLAHRIARLAKIFCSILFRKTNTTCLSLVN